MYAKGLTTRQISEQIEDIYGFEVSEATIQRLEYEYIYSNYGEGRLQSKIAEDAFKAHNAVEREAVQIELIDLAKQFEDDSRPKTQNGDDTREEDDNIQL